MADITRRSFFKKAGLLIPATTVLPGMLLSDIRDPIEVPFKTQASIFGTSQVIDEVGLFSHGKLVKRKMFSEGGRCIMEGDTLRVIWTEEFIF
jgi:hypothetical protein